VVQPWWVAQTALHLHMHMHMHLFQTLTEISRCFVSRGQHDSIGWYKPTPTFSCCVFSGVLRLQESVAVSSN
jgi:hypothetical protein